MTPLLKLVIPKGRLQEKVEGLLARIGLHLTYSSRSYRPVCSDPAIEIKLLKPQNIPALIALGRHDAGFSGLDWVIEQGLETHDNLREVMDLGFNRVRIVAAVPETLAVDEAYRKRRIIVATEYPVIAQRYLDAQKLDAVLIKSYGATEALPPEDADMIIDNTSTGSTLAMNRLAIVDELLSSTTRLLASGEALDDPARAGKLAEIRMLIQSVLNADKKVLLEMNVGAAQLEALVSNLPCMRAPTVSPLHDGAGYAVKVAVSAAEAPRLIPQLVKLGASDILEYRLAKIVP
ncbi:MAG: ATP phosphoribosyltransferase [Vampirovibrionales bacterium]|nr:ATP phosphoribosyltransferase [Vampirovibrionales bacterium]